jgi:hypothetical protein
MSAVAELLNVRFAEVVELADTQDLGSCASACGFESRLPHGWPTRCAHLRDVAGTFPGARYVPNVRAMWA